MKLLVVLAVAALAFWFIGSRIVDRGNDLSAVAKSSEDSINSVAGVLQQARANVQGHKAPGETAWEKETNGLCARQSTALSRLGTPSSLDEIAAYLSQALPIVRRQHKRFAAVSPPAALAGPAGRAGRSFRKQERGLARVRAAARRGDSRSTLDGVEKLRSLARAANPNLIELGLTDCTLPSWGIPL